MKILDLFAGIGGFSLAGHELGWETAAFVERDRFCQAVLRTTFGDDIEIHDDITTFDGKSFRGRCDIITAGFPCQPFSAAGKRQGDTDDRFLWPETVRVVDEARPEWCVFENVAGLLSMVESDSLSDVEIKEVQLFHADENYRVNTIIERIQRRIVGRILEDIEAIGYSPLRMPDGTPVILCLPACAVGAWHRRDRLWIVAFDERSNVEHGNSERLAGSGVSVRPGKSRQTTSDIDRANLADGFALDATEPRLSVAGHAGQRKLQAETGKGLDDRFKQPDSDAADKSGNRCGQGSEIGGRIEGGVRAKGQRGRPADDDRNAPDLSNARTPRRQRQQADDAGSGRCGSDLSGECERSDGPDATPNDNNAGIGAPGRETDAIRRPDGVERQHSLDQSCGHDGESSADSNGSKHRTHDHRNDEIGQTKVGKREIGLRSEARGHHSDATDGGSIGSPRPGELERSCGSATSGKREVYRAVDEDWRFDHWLEAATELCRVVYEVPEELDAADVETLSQAVKFYGREEVERKTGLDLSEIESRVWRTERLKALGNTIVPEVFLRIAKVIDSLRGYR